MNNRSCNVDLCRFIASLLIVAVHLSMKAFCAAWLYVEFFLIITGYYTAKHFDGKNYSNPMKESIVYTLKKFIPVFPYTVIMTISMYILYFLPKFITGELGIKQCLTDKSEMFFLDLLLITGINENSIIGVLWYISALLYIFPLFSWFVQLRNRYWIVAVTSVYTLLFYGYNNGIPFITRTISTVNRVLAGMCIGVLVYEIMYIFRDYFDRMSKGLLTIIEIVTFTLPIVLVYKGFDRSCFILPCFVISLSISLSNVSYTKLIKSKVINCLGRLSMPIYVFHYFFVELNNNYVKFVGKNKVIFVYALTIITSIIAMHFIDRWKWLQNVIKSPMELRD